MKNIEEILPADRIARLRKDGFIVFDVDDTLLARRKTPTGRDQSFSDSESAQTLPHLLSVGMRICIITGHGWRQLKERLIDPIAEQVMARNPEQGERILGELYVYANRGATRIKRDNGRFVVDREYGSIYQIDPEDEMALKTIISELARSFESKIESDTDRVYTTTRESADDQLLPQLVEREGVVIALRPIPSQKFGGNNSDVSPRRKLMEIGQRKLRSAGLAEKYELSESGTSTLEIMRRDVAKDVAFRDVVGRIAEKSKIASEPVEDSSVVIGDEFAFGGNDHILALNFPSALCLSVSSKTSRDFPPNVIALDSAPKDGNLAISAELCWGLLNLLVKYRQSDNL